MKIKSFLFGLPLLAIALLPHLSWADSDCTEQTINAIVKNLGYVDSPNHISDMNCLAKYPVASAGLLTRQLEVVTDIKVTPEQAPEHKQTMHVVWSLRALRYLTGGMDFTASTTASIKTLGKPRWGLLTIRDKKKLTFFGTRMSHDAVYLAPQDVQSEVIKQWNDWYRKDGNNYNYHTAATSADWYF